MRRKAADTAKRTARRGTTGSDRFTATLPTTATPANSTAARATRPPPIQAVRWGRSRTGGRRIGRDVTSRSSLVLILWIGPGTRSRVEKDGGPAGNGSPACVLESCLQGQIPPPNI